MRSNLLWLFPDLNHAGRLPVWQQLDMLHTARLMLAALGSLFVLALFLLAASVVMLVWYLHTGNHGFTPRLFGTLATGLPGLGLLAFALWHLRTILKWKRDYTPPLPAA